MCKTWKLQKLHTKKETFGKNGEVYHVQGRKDSILLGCQFFLDWTTDSVQLHPKFHQAFLKLETGKLILKFIWECKWPKIAKAI